MNHADEVHAVALRLIDLLEGNAVPYALMGGLAVPVWGIPRATYDVDVVLSVDDAGLRLFVELAEREGFEVGPEYESGFRDALEGMEKIRIEWWTQRSRRIEVDVFLVTTRYQEEAFSRRRRVRLDGRDVWVLSAADLILHKLVAGRPKDLADIQNILLVQGVPDEGYLEHWAERLRVAEALRKAVRDARLPGSDR